MLEKCQKALRAVVVAAVTLQSLGCGTIIHPERKGQKAGRLDAGIVVLDAIGLLFFIIPGVIAFAVDFNNGCIYLPSSGTGILGLNEMQKLPFDPKGDAKSQIESLLKIDMDRADLRMRKLDSVEELPAMFAEAKRGAANARRTASLSGSRPRTDS